MSARKVERAEALMPVRRRLMKAVFFLSAESRDLLVENTSGCKSLESPQRWAAMTFRHKGSQVEYYQIRLPRLARLGREAPL